MSSLQSDASDIVKELYCGRCAVTVGVSIGAEMAGLHAYYAQAVRSVLSEPSPANILIENAGWMYLTLVAGGFVFRKLVAAGILNRDM